MIDPTRYVIQSVLQEVMLDEIIGSVNNHSISIYVVLNILVSLFIGLSILLDIDSSIVAIDLDDVLIIA